MATLRYTANPGNGARRKRSPARLIAGLLLAAVILLIILAATGVL